MSKYTEAIRMRKSGLLLTNEEWRMLADTIDNALEIADRLEQVGKLGVVCKPQKYGSKTEAFAEGYKQAIKDIRGDAE